MEYKWNKMTNKERDELISKNLLHLECFETEEGLEWYERHYKMGFWHYSTNLNSAIDLAERIAMKLDVDVEIIFRKGKHLCRITPPDNMPTPFLEGETIQEAICLATILYVGIDVQQ